MRLHLMFALIGLSLMFPVSAAQSAEQLSASDMKMATEMNKVYAKHMYSSTCVDRQRMMFVPPILSAQEKASRMVSFQKSCDCLTDGLLNSFSPNDVIGFVTYFNGSVAPGTKKAKPDQQTAQKNAQIMMYARDKETRQGCGFKQ